MALKYHTSLISHHTVPGVVKSSVFCVDTRPVEILVKSTTLYL